MYQIVYGDSQVIISFNYKLLDVINLVIYVLFQFLILRDDFLFAYISSFNCGFFLIKSSNYNFDERADKNLALFIFNKIFFKSSLSIGDPSILTIIKTIIDINNFNIII